MYKQVVLLLLPKVLRMFANGLVAITLVTTLMGKDLTL